MKICDEITSAKLTDMTKGWFVGDFSPSLHKTQDVEVGIKRYSAGDTENFHYHKIATEFTVIIEGTVEMDGKRYSKDDIITVPPGVKTNFKAITDTVTTVVKIPGAQDDKYTD